MNGWVLAFGALVIIIALENILLWKIAHDRTGLWTRWVFDVIYSRIYKKGGWVIMIDMNDLKSINDQYGHTAGDLMIQEITNAVRLTSRFSFRWGGDEFAILLGKVPPEEVEAMINQLRIEISKTIIYASPIEGGNGKKIQGTAAIGYGHDQQSADAAMYRDKANYKNNCH